MGMQGRRYTWSNDRQSPHMARLDRFLLSTEWNSTYPNSAQRALPNMSSDHCPILFTTKTEYRKSMCFRFENYWLRNQLFKEMIVQEWAAGGVVKNLSQLHAKFGHIQHKIKEWTNSKIGNIKNQIKTCREFLGWLDEVKEIRQPTELESFIATLLKQRYTELAILEEERWKQRAKAK